MVAWYPLDELSGPISAEIANANTGTWLGGPAPIPGKVAGGLNFNGATSMVQAANSPTLNFGQGDLSIDMWVKTLKRPGPVLLLDKRAGTPFFPLGYAMYLYNGKLGFQLADSSGWSNYIAFSGPNVGDGNWHLVAVSVQRTSSTGLKLYVDGVLVGTYNPTARAGSITNVATLRLGAPQPFGGIYLRGVLDEVELFNRALAGSEFAAIYGAGSAGKCKPQLPTPTITPTGTPPTSTPTTTATRTFTPTATPTPCYNPFVDINGNIFYSSITRLYCNHTVNGLDGNHFGPSSTATRAQFAKVVVLGFGIWQITPETPDFTDVPPTYYAYTYIESGYEYGVLGGYDPATCAANGVAYPCYLPNRAITRAELTKLVVVAANYDLISPPNPSFSDVPTTHFAYAYIETAHAKNVVNGYADGTFRPNNNIRRDEMCQIVNKGRVPH